MSDLQLVPKEEIQPVMDLIKTRIMWQFRKGKWIKEISDAIENVFASHSKDVYNMGMNEGMKNYEEQYKNYIPAPTANFKTRMKFLFTGKLA